MLSFCSLIKEQKKASPDGMRDVFNLVDAFVIKWFAVEPKSLTLQHWSISIAKSKRCANINGAFVGYFS